MKILYVTLGFYPAVAWGGPVKIVHQNALEMKRRGHDVTICTTNLMDKYAYIEPGSFERDVDGLRVVYLQTYGLSKWPGSLGPTYMPPSANKWLKAEVEKADVVHVNGVRFTLAMSAIRHAQRINKPLLIQPHGVLPHTVNSVRIKAVYDKLITRNIMPKVDGFVAGQKAETAQIINAGGRPDRIHIIANGLDITRYNADDYRGQFREAYKIPADEQIILFLGRINHKKGTDLLVEAYAQLDPAVRAKARLVIAGPDDGQLAEVNQLIAKYELHDRVLLTGLLSDMIWSAYVDADIFVLPCRTDTFPMAIIEACRAGAPMVICETCEIADIVKDVVATTPAAEAGAIANAIGELLQDETLRVRYKEGAKRLMETTFSITAVGQQLEDLYTNVQQSLVDA